MSTAANLLPGSELIEQGLEDLSHGLESVAALLVSIGAPRLRQLGIQVPNPIAEPERRLYEVLRASHADGAHSRYNALVRSCQLRGAAACGNSRPEESDASCVRSPLGDAP